jgi:hypothetical protein
MARLISKSDLAKASSVSRAAITQAARLGGALASALVGEELDLDSYAVKRYLKKKNLDEAALLVLGFCANDLENLIDPIEIQDQEFIENKKTQTEDMMAAPETAEMNSAIEKSSEEPGSLNVESGSIMDQYGNKTLYEIIRFYGSDAKFSKVIQAMKQVAELEAKQITIAQQRGDVISRSLVKERVFGAFEAANMKLLNDLPGSITRFLSSAIKTGTPPEEAEKEVRQMISMVLNDAKVSAKRAVTNA